MSTPIEELERDHRLIERMLAVLQAANAKLGSGEEVAPEHLERAVGFVRGFADGSHHAKEERCLFPMLAVKGPMLESGPIRVMLAEHEEGRRFISSLTEGIEAMRAGEPAGRDTVRTAIAGYTMLLRDHIAKEEGVLFPMAQNLLSANDESQLREEFDRAEEDVEESTRERFEKVVAELEDVFT